MEGIPPKIIRPRPSLKVRHVCNGCRLVGGCMCEYPDDKAWMENESTLREYRAPAGGQGMSKTLVDKYVNRILDQTREDEKKDEELVIVRGNASNKAQKKAIVDENKKSSATNGKDKTLNKSRGSMARIGFTDQYPLDKSAGEVQETDEVLTPNKRAALPPPRPKDTAIPPHVSKDAVSFVWMGERNRMKREMKARPSSAISAGDLFRHRTNRHFNKGIKTGHYRKVEKVRHLKSSDVMNVREAMNHRAESYDRTKANDDCGEIDEHGSSDIKYKYRRTAVPLDAYGFGAQIGTATALSRQIADTPEDDRSDGRVCEPKWDEEVKADQELVDDVAKLYRVPKKEPLKRVTSGGKVLTNWRRYIYNKVTNYDEVKPKYLENWPVRVDEKVQRGHVDAERESFPWIDYHRLEEEKEYFENKVEEKKLVYGLQLRPGSAKQIVRDTKRNKPAIRRPRTAQMSSQAAVNEALNRGNQAAPIRPRSSGAYLESTKEQQEAASAAGNEDDPFYSQPSGPVRIPDMKVVDRVKIIPWLYSEMLKSKERLEKDGFDHRKEAPIAAKGKYAQEASSYWVCSKHLEKDGKVDRAKSIFPFACDDGMVFKIEDQIKTREEALVMLQRNVDNLLQVAYKPPDLVALCCEKNTALWIWKVKTGRIIRIKPIEMTRSQNERLRAKNFEFLKVLFLPTYGNAMVTSSSDGAIRFWRIGTEIKLMDEIYEAHPHHYSITNIVSDNKDWVVFTGDNHGHVKVWKVVALDESNDDKVVEPRKVSFHKKKERLYVSAASCYYWRAHSENVDSIEYVASRNVLVTSHGHTYRFWSLAGQLLKELAYDGADIGDAISDDVSADWSQSEIEANISTDSTQPHGRRSPSGAHRKPASSDSAQFLDPIAISQIPY